MALATRALEPREAESHWGSGHPGHSRPEALAEQEFAVAIAPLEVDADRPTLEARSPVDAGVGRCAMPWHEIYWRLRAETNDASAWAALEALVRRWARRALQGRDPDTIEEAVADTCASAVLSLGQAHGGDTFSGFVYGHFRNQCRRIYRQGREPVVRLGDLDVPDPPSEDEDGPTDEELAALRQALTELPPRQCRAVVMRYFFRRSAAEIATALGVREGNARWLVFDGLTRLRRRLTDAQERSIARLGFTEA